MRSRQPDARAETLQDEADLVRRAKAGDASAFGQLYDAHVRRIYKYVFFRVSDTETTEDLTSAVFLKAWENLRGYRPSGPFLAWLYTIARNTVIDHYRTRKPAVKLEDVVLYKEAELDEGLDRQIDAAVLKEAMQTLTDEQQEVLALRFIHELDTEEIARRMHKTEGAIRALQMRALQALARTMNASGRSEE
ncbi:MAG TPA: RNA polymerase sigma factor [Anaerolineales bacterium]|nr:RNA polymerase sigma factor [Anaerolineales bacterium]